VATLLPMPGVAAGATEAVLQEWLVAAGTAFDAGDALATVETEKALVEVEAERAGVLLKPLVEGGAQVEVGAPIALLGAPDEQVADLDAVLSELGVVSVASTAGPERRTVPDDPEGGTANTDLPPLPEIPVPVEAQGAGEQRRIFASPLARRLAAEAGIPLTEIHGTGPRGRVLRRDVDAAAEGRQTGVGPAPATEAAPPARPTGTSSTLPGAAAFTEVPHSRMRRAISTRLTESKRDVPHFYVRATVRAGRLTRLRERLNAAPDTRVSLNDLVVKAVARAHTLVPEANVVWTPDAMHAFSSVDVAVAVATDSGLVTPVLRGVDGLPLSKVAAGLRDLAERARAGRLRQAELEGGSITVTNLGMFGTEEFAAIINPPQSAILAVGAVRQEPVAGKRRVTSAQVMRVTLSVDHRAIDGALAARWMQTLVATLEDPVQILV
jgi:pyruvate dehydrogenase E2 component (dihydrolipoamide acetyltransferase)